MKISVSNFRGNYPFQNFGAEKLKIPPLRHLDNADDGDESVT